MTFSLVKEHNHVSTVGSAIGFNNMMVVAGGALLQPLVGIILKWYWDAGMVDSVPVYSIEAYRMGMLTIPGCYLISMVLAIFAIRESHCNDLYHNT